MKHLVSVLALALCANACNTPPEPGGGRATPEPPSSGATMPAATRAKPKPKAKGPFAESTNPAMTDPSKAAAKAPAEFSAKFETTAGDFVVTCHRDWAPHGVDRFYNLVEIGYFNDNALFRVVKGFVVQWGIHGNPKVNKHWSQANLAADKVVKSNERGTLTYAMAGRPDTRSTQLFINFKANKVLDEKGFAPICEVVEGMKTVDAFYAGYREMPSREQGKIQAEGNAFLRKRYPLLDYIKSASLVDPAAAASASASAAAAPAKATTSAKASPATPAASTRAVK